MSDQPLLSIVIPCFNEEEALPLVVLPLVNHLRQSGVPFQLILVDNGSQDSTGAVIDRFVALDSDICKVNVPVNKGYGLGISTTTSVVICVLCQDVRQ